MNKKKIAQIIGLINPNRSGGVSRFELEAAYKLLVEIEEAREPARDDRRFYSGIISALAIVKLHGADTIFAEIVDLCDLPSLLAHAEAEGEIDFAGLSRLYEEWKYQGPV